MAKGTKSPIHSVKHYVQHSVFTVGLGAILQADIAIAVAAPAANNQVKEGSIVKAVYVELWITSDDAASGSFSFSIEKRPAAAVGMTFAQSQALFTYPNKKNILYNSQGLNNPRAGVAMPVFKGWIAIPLGKQRMGLGDRIVYNVAGITNGLDGCGFETYKEYQ